ncbi:amidohydrolase family protein [uncultured Tenacibaculum sp.]|uniref:amidohydrolase family protein n=1 Tax=uncultured Tenacibaculum sp. TaxID=174713 RepID=UPI002614EB37|nr:amidohydrolase family protein [uncultured Tenacibaculum sp.]
MIKFNFKILLFFFIVITNSQAQNKKTLIENVHIIPMDVDTILKNYNVLIHKNRIEKIAPNSSLLNWKYDTLITGTNKYLLPGFAEMHFHNQTDIKNEFKLLVANGITSARNMAEDKKQDQIKNKKLSEKLTIAPKYYTTGPYLQRKDLKTEEEVVSVVSYHKKRGYDYIKLADNLPKNIYLKLLREAQKNQLEVIGHGQRKMPLEYSLRMKSIAHIEEFMNIFSEKERENSVFLKKAAKQIKTSGVYVSPTLGIFDMISNYADNDRHDKLLKKEELKYLPNYYKDYWVSDSVHYRKYEWFTSKKSLKRLAKELQWQQMFTKLLHNEGVPLLTSSDTYGLFLPGFSLHTELEFINKSGLTTYETLKTATIIPARYFNAISEEGSVSEGKNANLVLLEDNPLENITNTRKIAGVFVKGNFLSKSKIDKILREVENSCKQ